MSAFSRNLRHWRIKRGLSQYRLARSIGMQPCNYVVYESGRHEPTLRTLVRIAQALGVSTDELLKGVAEEMDTVSAVPREGTK